MGILLCESRFQPEHRAADLVAATFAAEEDVTADVDAFADWLYSQCMGHADVRTGWVPRCADALAAKVAAADVPMLVALQGYPRADVCFAASMALRARYLAHWNLRRTGGAA